jgi:endoglucanase
LTSTLPNGIRRGMVAITVAGALALTGIGVAPALADQPNPSKGPGTSEFKGVNWADPRDNYASDAVVPTGLSTSDSYDQVYAASQKILGGFAQNLGANTVRLPINPASVGTAWWDSYRGAIDAAVAAGDKVILSYWEADTSKDGFIDDVPAWKTMWNTVVAQYLHTSNVYFEPMNEPHGYSSTEWRDVAANWLSYHYSAPPSRVLIGGTGYSQDLRDICNDSRFNSTLLSFHHYAFMYSAMTYDAFLSHIQTRLGNCASRAVATEFGAAMNSGLDYSDANSSENFVRYLRAVAQVMRNNQMGGTYWPALGGKPGTIGYDGYSMYVLSGSGSSLNLTIRNTSGADRVRFAWGDNVGGSTTTYYRVNVRHSGKAMDVQQPNTADGARVGQYTYNGGAWQQWQFQDAGSGYWRIVSRHSGKCLDVVGASTADGAEIVQYACGTGTNQQFQMVANGSYFQLRARHSSKCVDVPAASTADGVILKQYPCNTGTNQQWSRTVV